MSSDIDEIDNDLRMARAMIPIIQHSTWNDEQRAAITRGFREGWRCRGLDAADRDARIGRGEAKPSGAPGAIESEVATLHAEGKLESYMGKVIATNEANAARAADNASRHFEAESRRTAAIDRIGEFTEVIADAGSRRIDCAGSRRKGGRGDL